MKVRNLLAIVALFATAAYAKVTTDFDSSANFSQFHTYAWAQGTPAQDPLMAQRIVEGIDAQLAAKGLTKAASADAADVLVMPYADLPVTRAMQPPKLLEYLATALPVVATPLPANREWSDALDLVGDADAFAAIALARAEQGLPPVQRRARARLASESWAVKAAEFERLCLTTARP